MTYFKFELVFMLAGLSLTFRQPIRVREGFNSFQFWNDATHTKPSFKKTVKLGEGPDVDMCSKKKLQQLFEPVVEGLTNQ